MTTFVAKWFQEETDNPVLEILHNDTGASVIATDREETAVYGITFSSDIFPNASYETNSVVATCKAKNSMFEDVEFFASAPSGGLNRISFNANQISDNWQYGVITFTIY